MKGKGIPRRRLTLLLRITPGLQLTSILSRRPFRPSLLYGCNALTTRLPPQFFPGSAGWNLPQTNPSQGILFSNPPLAFKTFSGACRGPPSSQRHLSSKRIGSPRASRASSFQAPSPSDDARILSAEAGFFFLVFVD